MVLTKKKKKKQLVIMFLSNRLLKNADTAIVMYYVRLTSITYSKFVSKEIRFEKF